MRLRGAYQVVLVAAPRAGIDPNDCLKCIDSIIVGLGGKSEIIKRTEDLADMYKKG
jgi:hypothetical protein